MPKNQVLITKIPLSPNSKPRDIKQNFKRQHILYLELLENKKKVKQDLIDKDYIPQNIIEEEKPIIKVEEEKVQEDKYSKKIKDDFNEINEEVFINNSKSSSKSSSSSSNSSDSEIGRRLREVLKQDNKSLSTNNKYNRSVSTNNSKSIKSERSNRTNRSDKYNNKIPPTLAELEAKGLVNRQKDLKDVNYISKDSDEEEKRRIIFKFEIMKKTYPDIQIPEYTIHSDINTMKKTYDTVLRRISLDTSVKNNKNNMKMLFYGIELLFGNFLGFDMKGYATHQLTNMNQYEAMLLEIGEKSYVPEDQKLPVEIRLIGGILMSTAIFVFGKMVEKNINVSIHNMMKNFSTEETNTEKSTKRGRMKGPDIDLDDIPDL